MITKELKKKYHPTIGIECHVQLKTKSKLFSSAGNDAREAPPNSLVNHIDFGLPGALPVLNEAAVQLAITAAFALNTKPQNFSKFDRKHYFYPDLPMGYQITQYDQPIVLGGQVEIEVNGQTKTIGITRAHLEADAGKSTHPDGKDYSLIDLNRAGTPLLEIVSEPDMHTSLEAKTYARELYLNMKYAGVSDADLYYGNMRFDVNVSISKDLKALGTRTETKNLNSFRAVEKTIDYEIDRQIEVLERGLPIKQETRGWDDAKQKTFSQRSKENADDYRYMPDPDIPPVVLSEAQIEAVQVTMPTLPNEWRQRLSQLGLASDHIETLLDAEVEAGQASYLTLIENNLSAPKAAKFLANWFVNLEIPMRREAKISSKLSSQDRERLYLEVFALSEAGKLSSTKTKALIVELMNEKTLLINVADYVATKDYAQISDEAELAKIVGKAIEENPKATEDVKAGEAKAAQFLVGQVMKLSAGKANPQVALGLIKRQLGV
ncbi:MAG TPA: Asp-tRNA(Asn)/Glu-tRNA(Gln) amidotransferase subunit GatB [Candidatus Binatia bacterium]|nr:Asp-tRNA(Asn)/Glu-tRNA(Gln) amidotransferase subunit GatB [Candidatus Binatia bacterium]